ncbi:hypothetical protein DXG01_001032 [Tephrocybe rancida]|nr:hypothetical protein DXG01_001032 [Tephrocybe rancida]
MSFSQPKNFEINGGTFTNVAGSHYNTKHLIVQQSDIARAAPDSLINTIDAATSSELRTQATQLTESSPINATGAVVNNIARDNYNVKNLSLSYRDSGTSTLSVLLDATSPSAAFNSRERHPPPKCHPGTRQAILDEITAWVDLGPGEDDAERILWVHGPAGAGKSAVAQTIAENCDHKKLLAASFFFSRAHAARNSIDRLFITIAYQLAVSISPLRPEILSSFSNDPSIVNQAISAQVDKLIIAPFQALAASQAQSSHAEPSPFIVIIDGLDECAEKGNQSEVLDHVLRLIKIPAITLRFLIVSRPEHTIKDTLEQHEFSVVSSTPVDLYVDLDNDLGAWEDVYDYLNHEFARIRDSPKHRSWMSRFRDTPWPTESEVDCLVEKSGGYFIYAVTLAKFVDQENTSPITRLAFILSSESSQDDPFEELDKLYHHILTEVINTLVDHIQNTAVHNLKRKRSDLHQDTSLRHRQQAFTVLQEVLRAVAGEVPDDFIAEFYGLDNDQVLLTFRGLQSIMLFDDGFGDYEDMLSYCAPSTHRPAHATVYDFLFDPARAGHFHISPVSESFWADQFCLMLDYLHRYNQYTETMDWSQPPREPSLRTVIYINRNILSVWTKAGPSNQSALLKAIQTKSHNFWFPLPPSAPALPWGDVKFVSLCAACLSSVVMLTDAVLKGWYASLASYFKQVCDTVLKPLFSPPQHLFESERIISVYAVHSVPPINMGTVTMLLGLQHPLHPPIQKLLYILGRSYNIFPYLQHTLVSGEVANIRMVTLCLELIATADMDDTLADVCVIHHIGGSEYYLMAEQQWSTLLC